MLKNTLAALPKSILDKVDQLAPRKAFDPQHYNEFKQREERAAFHGQQAQIARERNERFIRKLMDRSGVQDIYLTATLDNYLICHDGQQAAVDKCRRYLAEFGQILAKRNMMFCGTTGTGKNHMASAICNALIASGKSAVVATALELQMKVRAARRHDSPLTEDKVIGSFAGVDLLVLDEIELGSTQDYDGKIINTVIDKRVTQGKGTILLSNLPAEELMAHLGERIVSRLVPSNYLVECKWPDYRTRR
ncbi:ATP-binding protein [Rheinheimera sp.]|uniref:ATP-binding protein n=1 Tax=Rheinheimera sp. TaxID=1869214 RepID=UPI00273320B3|nr:ATP-binding protein [Rheinheimera sp.]MDP2715519.1 ATP-binding protein [Rheinheimera sp.]